MQKIDFYKIYNNTLYITNYNNLMALEYDYLFKIIIIGDSGVGKSAILNRFADNKFTESYISTIGVDFKIKTILLDEHIIKLQLWDTAGQERFRTITTSYYRDSHIIFLCYDITDPESFANLPNWLKEIKKYALEKTKIIICGTKIDLEKKRKVMKQDAINFASSNNLDYIEVSSKTNFNIDKLFETSCRTLLKNFISMLDNNTKIKPSNSKKVIPLGINLNSNKKTNKCC